MVRNAAEPGQWIRELPRVEASPAFTREVMRRVRWRDRRRPAVWRLAAGLAMAACLMVVLQVTFAHRAEQRRMAALRAEQQKIERELEAVKRIAEDSEPVVVLENDQGTRVIMDLDSAIRPVSYRTYD